MSQICLLLVLLFVFNKRQGLDPKNLSQKLFRLLLAAPLPLDIFHGQRRQTQCDGTRYPPTCPTRAAALQGSTGTALSGPLKTEASPIETLKLKIQNKMLRFLKAAKI